MPPTTPRCTQLDAAPHWRVVDFISDLHLQASEVATFDAWVRYLHNTPADAVCMDARVDAASRRKTGLSPSSMTGI